MPRVLGHASREAALIDSLPISPSIEVRSAGSAAATRAPRADLPSADSEPAAVSRLPSAVSASDSAVAAAVAEAASVTPASVVVRLPRTPVRESPRFTPSTTSASAAAVAVSTVGADPPPMYCDASHTTTTAARAASAHFITPPEDACFVAVVAAAREALATSAARGRRPELLSALPRSAGIAALSLSCCPPSIFRTPAASSPSLSAADFSPPSAVAPTRPRSGPAAFSSTPT